MLRKRVPKQRIFLAPKERERLMKLGLAVGPALRHLITVVTYASFRRWVRNKTQGRKAKKMGRPRTRAEICSIILRMAKETSWGPHQALDNIPPICVSQQKDVAAFQVDNVVCRERLGGLLKHYERRAA